MRPLFIFISLSVSLLNGLSDDGVGLAGFKSRANGFLFALLLAPFLSHPVFPFSSFILWVGILGWGLRSDRVLIILSQPYFTKLFLIIIIVIGTSNLSVMYFFKLQATKYVGIL